MPRHPDTECIHETNSFGAKKARQHPPPLPLLYSEEELRCIRVRGKARALTRLCVACEDLCAFGRRLEQLYREFCEPQVGDDFKYCNNCSRTLDGSCSVDQAALAEALHEQLGECTRKRGFEMPFSIVRWDILLAK